MTGKKTLVKITAGLKVGLGIGSSRTQAKSKSSQKLIQPIVAHELLLFHINLAMSDKKNQRNEKK